MIDNDGFGRRQPVQPQRMAAGALALLASAVSAWPATAQNATWLNRATVAGPSGTFDYNAGANWDTGAVPVDTAIFGATTTAGVSVTNFTAVGGWTFTAAAPAYSFTNSVHLTFTGAGIAINGGSASITSNSFLEFLNGFSVLASCNIRLPRLHVNLETVDCGGPSHFMRHNQYQGKSHDETGSHEKRFYQTKIEPHVE